MGIVALTASFISCKKSPERTMAGAEVNPRLQAILAEDTPEVYVDPTIEPPGEGCERLRIRPVPGSLGRFFNDSNYIHLEYAQAAGAVPVAEPHEKVWESSRGLIHIRSNKDIYVDSLTHSYPYLHPHAADLLYEIGRRFQDSLDARGGGEYRLKVTSVLRTPLTVGKLRRVNRNATSESAHRYGTTFDISYSKFICDNPNGTRRTFEDLKNLLAEILMDLRNEKRCAVKHERHQACFHITAAPAPKDKKK